MQRDSGDRMRRMFAERERLVVYVDRTDKERMLARARAEHKLLTEWARDVLRAFAADPHEAALEVAIRLDDAANPEADPITRLELKRECKHGVPRGWKCISCGGTAL